MPESNISELEAQTGLFRYTRNSFSAAGQDSYNQPPTQDPDAFTQLVNTMPVVAGPLDRRWGLVPVANIGNNQSPTRFDEFRVTANTIRGLVTADNTTATLYNETDFSTLLDPLFTYTNTAKVPRFLTSRSWLYSGNGGDMLKNSGLPGATQQNWGIQMLGTTPFGYGPNNPQQAVNGGFPVGHWVSPGNAQTQDGTYATYDTSQALDGTPNSPLVLLNYGFNVPVDLQITGVQADIFGYTTSADLDLVAKVTLVKSNVQFGVGYSKTVGLPSAAGKVSVGSNSDLWGTQWAPSDFDSPIGLGTNQGFYCTVSPQYTTPSTGQMFIDAVQITLFYEGSFQITNESGGTIDLTNGRRYYIIFKNAANNGTSDLSAPTSTTGPLTNQQVLLSSLPISPDPQVTNRVILATSDGGDLTTLYEVATIDNTVTSYTDSTPETVLLLNNVWLETDQFGIEHGVSGNTPPPPTDIFIKHLGRVYFLVDNILYFSKSDDEMTTSTGLICGRYEESVPGDYQLDISDEAEHGRALFSDGQTLYIATEKQVRRLYGDGPTDYNLPAIQFTEVGVMSQDTITTVAVEGRPAGVCWLTPDLKVIGSDFTFYQNIGKPVQDVLNTANTTLVATVARAIYFAQGPFQFWILGIPTGTNTTIDTFLIYDLIKKRWHVWKFPSTLSFGSIITNIISNGTPRLLIAGFYTAPVAPSFTDVDPVFVAPQPNIRTRWPFQITDSFIWQISPAMVQDQINLTTPPLTNPITATAQTTWQDFQDANLRKDFDELEVITLDPAMLLSIDGASNLAEFNNPDPVISNYQLDVSAFGEYKWYAAANPTTDRFYRFTFTSALADRSFLHGYRMDIIPEHRF